MAEIERELGWDDVIENDSPDFITLPKGDYDFEVINFERGRYNGGDKIPPCNMAIVSLRIVAPEGMTIIKHKLYLHTSTEGRLCAFFVGLGLRKHGEKVSMPWNKVVGARGRAKIGIYKWTGDKDGEEHERNEVVRFYDPADVKAQADAKAPVAAETPKFTAGAF